MRSTIILWADVKAGTLKLFCFPNSVFVWKQNVLVEGKRTCFQLKVGLSTEAASLSCCLASFASSFASNDMLKRVESETTLKKPLNCEATLLGSLIQQALMGVSAGPKFAMGVRQN